MLLYIGLSGALILYLKSLSRNSALVHNHSHYEQSHNELSSRCAVSLSVALNANEEERGGTMCFTMDVSQWLVAPLL